MIQDELLAFIGTAFGDLIWVHVGSHVWLALLGGRGYGLGAPT